MVFKNADLASRKIANFLEKTSLISDVNTQIGRYLTKTIYI
jgi:hypothetical protein